MIVIVACVTVYGLSLTATADDEMMIYSAGVVVAMSTRTGYPTTVTIDDPCVLAIQGERRQT